MRIMASEDSMKTKLCSSEVLAVGFALILVVVCCALPTLALPQSQSAKPASATVPKAFDTPQQAADALIKAAGDYDVPELLAILGPDGRDVVASDDPVQDKNNAQAFAKEAAAKNSVAISKSNPNRATIIVGEEQWPLPIPLVKTSGKWHFNTKEGRQEILFRRIGENELNAITVCRGYVSAQTEYASEVHDNSGINQYAQKIFSTPGKQDGLFWKNADGTPDGPIGDEVAKALEEGYTSGKGGFHGYYFKILKGQGTAAPNGAINYVIEGIMIGGFALVAVPAEYRVTGVKTFIVSYEGTVYQKDLGPDSLNIVKELELYNPDKTWQPTDDQWPQSVAAAAP